MPPEEPSKIIGKCYIVPLIIRSDRVYCRDPVDYRNPTTVTLLTLILFELSQMILDSDDRLISASCARVNTPGFS